MSEDSFVTGPHRVDRPPPELADGLAELWGRVTLAGGAAGFRPDSSVEVLRTTAAKVFDDVTARRAYLITLGQEHVLVGAAVLTPGDRPVARHTGDLTSLVIDPELQGKGWDQQLHDAALSQALALGLEKLSLCTRGGQGLERFYEANDWVERGRWPGGLRVGKQDERDEIWFTRDL